MLDVSFWELLIVGAIALVVVGPERLPRLMRTLGLWAGRARASFQSIRDEVEREVNAEGLRETKRAINREAKDTEQQINAAVDTRSAGRKPAAAATQKVATKSKASAGDAADADAASKKSESE